MPSMRPVSSLKLIVSMALSLVLAMDGLCLRQRFQGKAILEAMPGGVFQ